MRLAARIKHITKPYWPRLSAGIALSLLASGITAAIAWAVKPALDEVFVKKQYVYLNLLPAGVFLLFTAKGLLNFGQQYLMRSAGMKLVRETRNSLYDQILHLPTAFFGRESSGAVISRIINDADLLSSLISNVLRTFVIELPTVIFLLGIALYRRWDLTLVILLLLPFIAYSTRKFGKQVKKRRKEAQRKLSLLTQRVGEAIQGIKVIKVFNRENERMEKFRSENQRFYREFLRVIRFREFAGMVVDIVTGVGVAAVLWYGGTLVMREVITAGDFASILVAISMIFSPVKKLGEAYTALQESRASLERVDTLLDAQREEEGAVRVAGMEKSLVFDRVSFRYQESGALVLRDVSLEILMGEVIAVVGRSGVGKSTLIDLIPRFHSPTSGKVLLDGVDLREINLPSLRRLIGIVNQDVVLFNDTLRENIAFGRDGATEAEIKEAARLAYAEEFIEELPEKYETVIGERGLKLSGGQRQRIAIARAILKNPPILILDEATSSLDSVSEALVQKALESLMKGRTTIVIAHRLSTIRHADRIVIFERGSISDSGTHEELMSRSESYAKLYSAYALTDETLS